MLRVCAAQLQHGLKQGLEVISGLYNGRTAQRLRSMHERDDSNGFKSTPSGSRAAGATAALQSLGIFIVLSSEAAC
jgi:hypothetical protein